MFQAHSHRQCDQKAVQENRLKGNEVDFQQPAFRGGLLTLRWSRTVKKTGIRVWPTASKFLAQAVSDSFW
jgi:hypothetical protein